MSDRITDADRKRFELFQDVGCVCCWAHGIFRTPVEAHHLLAGGRRRGHAFTIPLCTWHHRAQSWVPMAQAEAIWGPSLANGSKPFHERYGSDDSLLAKTNEMLAKL